MPRIFCNTNTHAARHLVALVSLPVLPIIPIVESKAALPWFGHAQIVLPVSGQENFWRAWSAHLIYVQVALGTPKSRSPFPLTKELEVPKIETPHKIT